MKKLLIAWLVLLCLLTLSACQPSDTPDLPETEESLPETTAPHTHIPDKGSREDLTNATCLLEGQYTEVVRCSDCEIELSRTQKTLPPLGHTYKDRFCTRCGVEKASEGLSFRANGDGTCTLTGIGSCTDEDVIIPGVSPKGDTVTAIDNSAFYYLVNLKSIQIPDTVTSIGTDAFSYCANVTSILLSDNLNSIGSGAFSGCSQLQYNVLDDLRYLGTRTNPYFLLTGRSKNNNTYQINLLTRFVYGGAFSNCDTLTEIVIPNNVIEIGSHAFQECDELVSVTLSQSIKVIPDGLFSGCRKLERVQFPSGLTKIGQQAFMYCASLKEVELGKGLKTIDSYAFYFCTSLTQVHLPDSITFLGAYTFQDCRGLEKITLPQSITSIPQAMFKNCIALKEVELPSTLVRIGPSVFYNCQSIESMMIPASVNTIGVDAFKMSGIQSLYFEKPTGWERCDSPNDTVGESISNLHDPSWAAMTINLRFHDYTWKRR